MSTKQEIKPDLITIKQAAYMLSVAVATLRKWDNEGVFRAIRVGARGDRRYRMKDVQKVINHGLAK